MVRAPRRIRMSGAWAGMEVHAAGFEKPEHHYQRLQPSGRRGGNDKDLSSLFGGDILCKLIQQAVGADCVFFPPPARWFGVFLGSVWTDTLVWCCFYSRFLRDLHLSSLFLVENEAAKELWLFNYKCVPEQHAP